MSVSKRKDGSDLDSCYTHEDFVRVFGEKIAGWNTMSEVLKKVKAAGVGNQFLHGDITNFESFLKYTADLYDRAKSSGSGDFMTMQALRLYASVLESLCGLITESYVTSALQKLESQGLIDKNDVVSKAMKMQSMNDFEYCVYILDEYVLIMTDIQKDDIEDGFKPDARIEELKVKLMTTCNDIKTAGVADAEVRKYVDLIVGEVIEYTIQRLSKNSPSKSKFFLPLPNPSSSKPGSDLN